ncbi:NnrU family protein [Dechloromonas sp. A34]|uniref:NnrU family protein n=1 Tax=Dechloromonas sp. A34 TaxID=447588 RepID=UPI002249383D|nr:NnrU family protein [Dechloromonas sp. A34]
MLILLIGLLLFLATHSIRIVAEGWRGRQIARLGEKPWKGLYALLSALGLGLTVWGFGLAGAEAQFLWHPPRWTGHLAALLTLPAFVLLVAAYVPGSRIKAVVGHPMILGVAIWAFAHLIANGRTHAMVLFGAFFIWAVLDFAAARRREPTAEAKARSGTAARDALVVIIGAAAWALFAAYLHGWLIGVRPFG